jgi:hypothetical protein
MGLSNLQAEDIEKHLILTDILLADISAILLNADVFVPYIGATSNVDLGSNDFFTTGSIKNNADNSKHYFGAGDDYSIEWNGSDAVHTITAGDFVFSGGNVGIGTSSPGFKLSTLFTTNSTGAVASSFQMGTKSTGDMTDGFGGGFLFAIQDDTSSLVNVATIYGIRDGADYSGALTFNTYSTGSRHERMRITSAGDIKIPADSKKLYLGAGDDAYIEYDGNSMNITADDMEITCDDLKINGSTGWSGTFTNGDGDTVTVTNGLITNVA